MTSKRKADRIATILDSLKNAAAGDYSAKLDFASEKDDLGLIADAVNTLLQKTNERLLSAGQTPSNLLEDAGRCRYIIDNIEEFYFEVDLKGNINFVNDTVIRDLGYTQEELRGINFHQLVDETNAKKVYQVFHRVFLTGQSVKGFDWEILKKNKGKIDVESSVALLRDKTGKPAGFRGVVRDISKRAQARKDLQQSEEKCRTILDIMDEGYIEQDLKGRVTWVNDAACRLMGYQREQLIGMHYSDYLAPAFVQKMKDTFGGVYRTGLPARPVDYDLVRRNGTVITYEINVALKHDASEKPCGFLILTKDISSHKKAEKEKLLSEEKYRMILEIMQEGYFETDLRGNITFVNDAGCNLVGYQREEITGTNYHHYAPPETAKRMYGVYHDIYKNNTPAFMVDYEVIQKNGSIRIHQQNAALMHDESGLPKGFHALVRDVTELEKAGNALRESEALYRKALETTSDGVTIIRNAKHVYVNPQFLKTLNIPENQLADNELGVFIHPDDSKITRYYYEKRLRGEPTPGKHEIRIIKPDQTIMYLQVTSVDIVYHGKPALLNFMQNITTRKLAEDALKESERRYRLMCENVNDIIWTLNMDIEFTYVSESSTLVTGYTPEETKRTPLDQLLTPESYIRASQRLADELALERSGKPFDRNRPITLEVEAIHKDGSILWMEITGTFNRNDKGEITEILIMGRNFTRRKKAEQEKNKLEAQLIQAQKMEVVGRLAGGVAHDFNNMLSVILGYVDLAKLRLAKQHPVLKDIAEIEKAAIRSRDITTQLLAFSRKQIIEPRIIDLNDMIVHTQKALIRLIGEDIELKFHQEENLWAIKFDPSQIEQILINLAVNARDAMPDGGKLTIETSNLILDALFCRNHAGFTPGHYVRLSFGDNGVGMNKETLQYIFEPFFTTKEVGKGTGLGLATVYGIVKQNNGFINVYSEPGYGTTFNLYLPRTSGEENIQDASGSGEELETTGKGSILLVEDDAMVLQITRGMLESIGYGVTAISNPLEAISLFKNTGTTFDLIITDVVMPGLSGKDLRDRLVAIQPDIKVLFISGYTADVIARHGVLEEGVQFLQKPFTIKSLSGKVREVMTKKH